MRVQVALAEADVLRRDLDQFVFVNIGDGLLERQALWRGQADRFVFAAGGGHDRIADFQNGIDRVEIASGAERFAGLQITDAGAHVVIGYGADAITIENLDHRLIDAADFIFV